MMFEAGSLLNTFFENKNLEKKTDVYSGPELYALVAKYQIWMELGKHSLKPIYCNQNGCNGGAGIFMFVGESASMKNRYSQLDKKQAVSENILLTDQSPHNIYSTLTYMAKIIKGDEVMLPYNGDVPVDWGNEYCGSRTPGSLKPNEIAVYFPNDYQEYIRTWNQKADMGDF
jgi:hypothetical protein